MDNYNEPINKDKNQSGKSGNDQDSMGKSGQSGSSQSKQGQSGTATTSGRQTPGSQSLRDDEDNDQGKSRISQKAS